MGLVLRSSMAVVWTPFVEALAAAADLAGVEERAALPYSRLLCTLMRLVMQRNGTMRNEAACGQWK